LERTADNRDVMTRLSSDEHGGVLIRFGAYMAVRGGAG
jgi:hypothetical protein